jgi:hypothetical protein
MESICFNCNKPRKYIIICNNCGSDICRSCAEKYLLNLNKTNINEHCYYCEGKWDLSNLHENGLLTETFMNLFIPKIANIIDEIDDDLNKLEEENSVMNEINEELEQIQNEIELENETYLQFKVFQMPPDGSCFYHCILYSCKDIPEFQQLLQNYSILYEQTNKDNISILRYAISKNVSLEDFEQYKMLQDVGLYHSKCENIEDLKQLILVPNEYINDITINIFLRLMENKLGLYIYNNNMLVSPYEYRNKDYNIFLRLEGEHYDVLSINGKTVLEKNSSNLFLI